jgi:hypothetical protein
MVHGAGGGQIDREKMNAAAQTLSVIACCPVKADCLFSGHPKGLALIDPSTAACLIGSGLLKALSGQRRMDGAPLRRPFASPATGKRAAAGAFRDGSSPWRRQFRLRSRQPAPKGDAMPEAQWVRPYVLFLVQGFRVSTLAG